MTNSGENHPCSNKHGSGHHFPSTLKDPTEKHPKTRAGLAARTRPAAARSRGVPGIAPGPNRGADGGPKSCPCFDALRDLDKQKNQRQNLRPETIHIQGPCIPLTSQEETHFQLPAERWWLKPFQGARREPASQHHCFSLFVCHCLNFFLRKTQAGSIVPVNFQEMPIHHFLRGLAQKSPEWSTTQVVLQKSKKKSRNSRCEILVGEFNPPVTISHSGLRGKGPLLVTHRSVQPASSTRMQLTSMRRPLFLSCAPTPKLATKSGYTPKHKSIHVLHAYLKI